MGLIERIKSIAEIEKIPESDLSLRDARQFLREYGERSKNVIRLNYESGLLDSIELRYGNKFHRPITVYRR